MEKPASERTNSSSIGDSQRPATTTTEGHPPVDTSKRKGRFKVTNIDDDTCTKSTSNTSESKTNEESTKPVKQSSPADNKPKKSRFTVKSSEDVSTSNQISKEAAGHKTQVSTIASVSSASKEDAAASTSHSQDLNSPKKTTRFTVRDASDTSSNSVSNTQNTKPHSKPLADARSDGNSNNSSNNSTPTIAPSGNNNDATSTKRSKSRFTVKTINPPASSGNSSTISPSVNMISAPPTSTAVDSNVTSRLQSLIETNYQMLAHMQKELAILSGGNVAPSISAIPPTPPALQSTTEKESTAPSTSTSLSQTSQTSTSDYSHHTRANSLKKDSGSAGGSKSQSFGKLSHLINEMKKEVDLATKQRRESNLETQRLREKCMHLESLLAASNSKNTKLEERLDQCLNKQRYLQAQLDSVAQLQSSQVLQFSQQHGQAAYSQQQMQNPQRHHQTQNSVDQANSSQAQGSGGNTSTNASS